jgi:LmbE family N-acetylglucosaminyl deacetylase
MNFHNATADTFVPDGRPFEDALRRTTHLAVGAHQDDIEIMAYNGIASCFGRSDRWMTGVTVTNGAGSARTGVYADFTDEQMMQVRRREQRKAAFVGDYAAQVQLDYTSSQVKDPKVGEVVEDLFSIFQVAQPQVVYLHNPADKHDTHVAVCLRALEALRRLPAEQQPEQVYGCEVWRSLDWVHDQDKVVLSASAYPNLAAALVGLYDSQISGGKRYDLATAGRRLANATYLESHATDVESAVTYAVDLKPLLESPTLSVEEFMFTYMERFFEDVRDRLRRLTKAG